MAASLGDQILEHLQQVAQLRTAQKCEPEHLECVRALKAYQARRFERAYDDLLKTPRYAAATRFFLDELYGPQEFADRDAQFARIVPSLVRMFSADMLATVASLAELHALTEVMDDATARGLDGLRIDASAYIRAWQHAGRPDLRDRQIQLTLAIGKALDHFTQKRLFRTSLQLMRAPARAAGLGALQKFLEAGFDAFRAMKGAQEFLELVGNREKSLAQALFSASKFNTLEPPDAFDLKPDNHLALL